MASPSVTLDANKGAGTVPALTVDYVQTEKLFDFSHKFRDVPINLCGPDELPFFVWHRIGKPDKQAMIEHQNMQTSEQRAIGQNEVAVRPINTEADERLWTVCATHVRGYDFGDGNVSAWVELTDELKEALPEAHRLAAINGYYQGKCVYVPEEDFVTNEEGGRVGFRLSQGPMKFVLTIGPEDKPDYTVTWYARKAPELAKRTFQRERISQTLVTGASGGGNIQRSRVKYQPYINYLREITTGMEGAVCLGIPLSEATNPKKREAWFQEIDPLWAMEFIRAYNDAFRANVRDSRKL